MSRVRRAWGLRKWVRRVTLRHMGDLPLSKLIDIPPVWLAGFAVLAWIVGAVLPVDLRGLVFGFGTLLVAAGLILIVLAALQFRAHQTSIVPHMHAKSLITSGVFRFSRNPIYLADALILTGLCLRWDAAAALILVPIFIWIIQSRFIIAEEARLKADFPEEFAQYSAQTRRWV